MIEGKHHSMLPGNDRAQDQSVIPPTHGTTDSTKITPLHPIPAVVTQPVDDQESTGFRFLHFSHPSEIKAKRTRKAVRSHVTKRQHEKAKGKVSTPTRLYFPALGMLNLGPANPPQPQIQPRLEHIDTFPEYLLHWVQESVDFYAAAMLPDVDFLNGSHGKGLLRTKMLPCLLGHPGTFSALVLFIAPFMTIARGLQSRSDSVGVLTLQNFAINQINLALGSHIISDHLILAVGMMGYYEFLAGDRAVSMQHNEAMYNMIDMRGGTKTLGLDGLHERLIIWLDSHMAHILEKPPHFDLTSDTTSALTTPDLDVNTFLGHYG